MWYTHALLLGQIADTLSFTKEKRMSDEDFATSQEARKLADEIAGLKMMITEEVLPTLGVSVNWQAHS